MNPFYSGGGNDDITSESPDGDENATPDDENQDNNPKIAKLTGKNFATSRGELADRPRSLDYWFQLYI